MAHLAVAAAPAGITIRAMVFTALAPDIWVHRAGQRMFGVEVGRQLVVIALPARASHGRPMLWVQSPVVVTPALGSALDALGEVRHVMAASLLHDECLVQFQSAYPRAQVHGSPGFAAARRDVRFDAELGDTPHPDWAGTIDQHLVRGIPLINEVVFLHRASRSLILSDLAMNFGHDGSLWTRVMLSLAGARGRFGPTRLERSIMKDRKAVRRSIDTILGWDFDRIIVGHGDNIESGGREALRQAFAFLPSV